MSDRLWVTIPSRLEPQPGRIVSVCSRCPECHSRLRYAVSRNRWRCAQCGLVLVTPTVTVEREN